MIHSRVLNFYKESGTLEGKIGNIIKIVGLVWRSYTNLHKASRSNSRVTIKLKFRRYNLQ